MLAQSYYYKIINLELIPKLLIYEFLFGKIQSEDDALDDEKSFLLISYENTF